MISENSFEKGMREALKSSNVVKYVNMNEVLDDFDIKTIKQ
jgi:hypothetical protein